jgi:alpha-tubulin suppressor-like RCC1 family protein
VVGWGGNGFNQITIPPGLSNVVAIAAGETHSLALRSDRTVVAWGNNGLNQATVPPAATNVVSIAAGDAHSVALRADGTVVAWGFNTNGQATVPAGLANIVGIAAGFSHTAALRADGTVTMWGSNSFNVLNQPPGLGGIVAIVAGDFHTLALRSNGTVAAWGAAENGRIAVPAGLNNVVAMAAGNAHSLALRADGTVVGWGSNTYQQATPPAGLNNVVGIAASGVHSLALRNATSGNLPLSPITQQPTSTGVNAGQSASFSVVATGSPTYQWQKDNSPIPGATSATLTIPETIPSDAGEYSVVVTQGGASFTSVEATLTVNLPPGYPLIVGQPANATVNAGTPVAFVVSVAGDATAPVSFQWRKGTTAIPGATAASFVIPSTVATDAGSYSVRATNSAGYDISRSATLAVNVAPVIVAQPASALVTTGAPVSFTVVATGSPNPVYQWRKGGVPILGANNPTYNLASTTAADAGSFDVVVTNVAGSVTSAAALLTVTPAPTAPVITAQPASQTAAAGSSVTFTVAASGLPAPTFQWRRGTTAIAGATGATLTLNNVSAGDAGSYTVVVTNSVGSVTSNAAVLTVQAADPGRLINLSILTSITPADSFFTVGTFVGGPGTTGAKAVLIRAGGPSLVQFVGPAALADPRLDIFTGQTLFASNDNWGGGAQLSTAFAQVGAFGFAPPTSRDAAVFNAAMPIGGYTVQISGVGGATGTVIAELYDATPAGSFTTTTPRLVNVSVLKRIEAGTPLTAGFVVGGSTPRTVLIRAIGPTLAGPPFAVAGAMTDPLIELFDGSMGVVAANDNWGGGALLVAAFAAVGAFNLDGASRDAALRVTLDPGSYTARVSGVGSTGGTALVEVYEVP